VEADFRCLPGASVTPLIVTGRLELRPFRPEDAAELHEIFSDPETHTIGEGPFTSLAQTAAWIGRRAETERQHGLLWYAVCDRADGRMLGNCGLFAGRTGSAEPEIGYEIRRSCQGRGLATEAARAVLDDALAGGISRVWATIRPHNTASLRVAAKIGMTLRHTRPDSRGPLVYLARP
jgi:[ribosomal protein S5]-alanine N-acetyltransferase